MWLTADSVDVVNTACCEAPTAAVPRVWLVARSMNVTVPVGLRPPAPPETVAVNVTGWFNILGFGDEESVVVVPAETMSIPFEPLLSAGKLGSSPLYEALTPTNPTGNTGTVKAA